MKDFTLSGAAVFDGTPDPVIWVQDGTVAYYNTAALTMATEAGWKIEEGAALPEQLQTLGTGAAVALTGDWSDWRCSTDPVGGGTLLRFVREKDAVVGTRRLNQIAGRMRIPLGNLIGAIHLLEDGERRLPPEKIAQYRAIQKKSYHVLLRMLDSMEVLGWDQTPEPVLLDFGGLCQDVVYQASSLVEASGRRLEFDRTEGNLLVRGEEHLLRRMLYHLLSNALHAAGEGGAVFLRLSRRGEWVRLAVSDTGDGFSPEDLAIAFDPSAQQDDLTAIDSGLGIGISVCRTVVDRHGGRMALLSGGGGRAVVELPVAKSTEGSLRQSRMDYNGGLNEAMIQLSDVLPWQCFLENK